MARANRFLLQNLIRKHMNDKGMLKHLVNIMLVYESTYFLFVGNI